MPRSVGNSGLSTARRAQAGRALACSLFTLAALAAAASAQPAAGPDRFRDRGPGVPTSQFGTYVGSGELLVYAFYEYTRTGAFEYKPSEVGYVGDEDYLGKLVEREALLFLSYGFSDRLAVELEGALHTTATFDRAPGDASGVPPRLEESGLGDVEGQLRWKWREESDRSPALYSFFEVVFPLQSDKVLVGTQDWEYALGFGLLRGTSRGSINARIALAYDGADSQAEIGEYAVEWLRQVSSRWRLVLALEGESDEVSAIGEAQWWLSEHAVVKLNSGFGLTRKAPDVAPEVGILLRF